MANNLFITDLIKTKDYPAVHEAIKALGTLSAFRLHGQ
jgi:hypothetical protein